MTWSSFHRRGDVLRAVIAAADARLDGALPTDIEGVDAVFADDAELLGALTLKWHTRLAGRIDNAQLHQPMDLRAAVVTAWHETALALPGVRAVIDRHHAYADAGACSEALAAVVRTSTAKEHMMLASMAGLASAHDIRGIAVGRAIEDQARLTMPLARGAESPRGTLFDRLRAALTAA